MLGDERVLDAGCGNGRYLAALRERAHRGSVIGVDRSPGMLGAASGGLLAAADVRALPFPDDTFDVALAMHMLYHVPDRPRGARRAAPCRAFAVAPCSSSPTPSRTCGSSTRSSAFRRARSSTFTSENGFAELSDVFETVVLHEFVSELVLTDAAPVLAYAGSMSVFAGANGLESRLAEIGRRVGETIQREGAFRVRTAVGCFVCS